ncbi:hypothetical protein N8198_05580 [Gammaproteobacteria bacterium]|nr:hypothetical protein [Gammaproteobacteria bacterium]
MINQYKIVNINSTSTMMTGKERLLTVIATLLTGLWLTTTAAVAASELMTTARVPGTMSIDLLPDNPDNIINLADRRVIPIAVLGSTDFDINDLNPRTLKLRAVTQNLVGKSDKSLCRQLDINADSHMDLLCDFKIIGFKIQPGDIPIVIKAGTYQRQSLSAEALLRYRVE